MAKKTVATLQTGAKKNLAKIILAEKSKKSGAYTFKEMMVPADKVRDYIK
jgi:Domain of unknown function (DUF4295)